MTAHFQLVGIDATPFEPLFALSDDELRALGARRCIASEFPGYPCRVSLEDAQPGDTLLLLPYEHHPVDSPYRASGPIFVRRGVAPRRLPPGDVPGYVTRRLISWRAYDAQGSMVKADVCPGTEVAQALRDVLALPEIAYVHLHNARQGCFSCKVRRA